MKASRVSLAFALFAFCTGFAYSQTLGASSPAVRHVDSLKVLMIEALDSPEGKASAVLTGEMFSIAEKYFDASGKLVAVVRRVKKYRQAGCGRLQVILHQRGVLDPTSKERKTRASIIGIDYCVNGKAPTDKTEI